MWFYMTYFSAIWGKGRNFFFNNIFVLVDFSNGCIFAMSKEQNEITNN